MASRMTFAHLTAIKLKRYRVIVPPIAIQGAVVQRLDSLTQLLTATSRAVKDADELCRAATRAVLHQQLRIADHDPVE